MLLDDRLGFADRVSDSPPGSYVVLSTFPPTACGVATFSAALCGGLRSVGAEVGIVAVDHPDGPTDPAVVARLEGRDPLGWGAAVEAIDQADVFILQHEYGLYPGVDGESVGELLEAISTPTIVVAHTVLASPERPPTVRPGAGRRRGRRRRGDDPRRSAAAERLVRRSTRRRWS